MNTGKAVCQSQRRAGGRRAKDGRLESWKAGSAVVLALVFALSVSIFLSLPAKGQQVVLPGPQPQDMKFFGVGGQAWGGTNNWTVVPSVGGRVAVLRTLEVSTDSGVGRVVVFTNGYVVQSPVAVLAGTNIQTVTGTAQGGTNGFAAMDPIIIEGYSGIDRIIMMAQVHSVGTTNISTRQSITNLGAGAMIYRVGTNMIFTGVTNGPSSLRGGQFIAAGQKGQPVAVHILGGSACNINAVGGSYE